MHHPHNTPHTASGNRYEGMWLNDMKHGDGKYFYLDKGQVFQNLLRDQTDAYIIWKFLCAFAIDLLFMSSNSTPEYTFSHACARFYTGTPAGTGSGGTAVLHGNMGGGLCPLWRGVLAHAFACVL